ncbi:hypothetical protein K443DRAFT_70394, partial [Laccaria amethystina LaAM-08-1]
MTSAGEKQHYALVLLERLFDHLPSTARVGVLYDIGCQLHRSCVKWGFLKDFHDRLLWAISVFHAYGHQWACQLIYHPRKCTGFGLTDGEGCERFWSSIKLLIPSLRVSGYYTRIYTIDTQVKHLDHKSLMGLGDWLRRKWNAAILRKNEARAVLAELEQKDITEDLLRENWAAQMAQQTKPNPRQAKNLADKVIQEILELKDSMTEVKAELYKFETMIQTGKYDDGWEVSDVRLHLEDLKEKYEKTGKSLKSKCDTLGAESRLNLERLLGNEFFRLRVNALAVKQRLRNRLQQRKFELDGLERAYRKTTTNTKKLHEHSESQIKRKEPGIQKLAKKYNDICAELEKMIKRKESPRGACAPHRIATDGLFKLDVDDDIWQDVGLDDMDLSSGKEIPQWLGDEGVRKGIKSLLELDRC